MQAVTPESKSNSPTVYVDDEDASIREVQSWLMQSNRIAVRCYAGAAAFLAEFKPDSPGCLIVDLFMPGMSGLDLQQYLIRHGITMPVIFLSGRGDIGKAVEAVKQGAVDFIEKPFDYKRILLTVRECMQRDAAMRATRSSIDAFKVRLATLTQREREVMDYVVAGQTNREVAEILGISVKTVEAHRSRLMEKLDVDSVASLVQNAVVAKS
ncbi:MAG: response regulator transcription factor [Betaproteobacteria bacterium]|nr:response regulator transcription factor [Betaproteobacteria bacterium]